MLINFTANIRDRLTQMTLPCQSRVKANLPHLVCPPHEEVDDAISYHTVGKSLNDMVISVSDMETVPLFSPFFYRYGVKVSCSETRHLSHCTSHLRSLRLQK